MPLTIKKYLQHNTFQQSTKDMSCWKSRGKKKSHKWILKCFPGSKVSLFTITHIHTHRNQNTIQSGIIYFISQLQDVNIS